MQFSSGSEAVGGSRLQTDVSRAIARLTSLHNGDRALSEVVRFGIEAVPELRALLFKREPSGLYVARRRAVEALAALKSFDTLGEFLRLDREIESGRAARGRGRDKRRSPFDRAFAGRLGL